MIKKVSNRWQRIDVPQTFPNIHAALAYCKSQLNNLGDKGFIQIKIADGEYYLSQVEIDFFSDRVEIIGNLDNPDTVSYTHLRAHET